MPVGYTTDVTNRGERESRREREREREERHTCSTASNRTKGGGEEIKKQVVTEYDKEKKETAK